MVLASVSVPVLGLVIMGCKVTPTSPADVRFESVPFQTPMPGHYILDVIFNWE